MAIADFTNVPLTELFSLKGRRAVITGGARGIGEGIVKRLAEAGASIVIGDIDIGGATQVARSTSSAIGTPIHAMAFDLENVSSIVDFVEAATTKLGGIDIWVNNAGYYPFAAALEMDVDEWDKVQSVNLRGAFVSAREAARRMIACRSRHSVIVNIASVSGVRARLNMSHYIAAKHGLVGLTKAMALEFADKNIRVLAIAPGHILTRDQTAELGEKIGKLYPVGRPGVADDIARAVLFCVSDLSAFMTGSMLMVEGGSCAGVFS